MNKKNIVFCPINHNPSLGKQKEQMVFSVTDAGSRDNGYYYFDDIMAFFGVSKSKAYKIIQLLKKELSDGGISEPPGRIPKEILKQKIYGKCERNEHGKS